MSVKDQFYKPSIIQEFLKKASNECIPLVTTIEITQGCNYKCHHCYNFDRTKEMPEAIKENALKPEEILSIIDQVAASGAFYINFTGGEALLHPHLEDFIKRARTHHLEARLKTNGSLLTVIRCEKLDLAGLASIDISLYGFSETSYQKLTGKEGMFGKTIDGIKNAIAQGFNVNINIILHRYNIDEIKQMADFCIDHKVAFQFSTEITERYDDSSGSKDFEITTKQFQEQLAGEYAEVFMTLNPDKALQCSCAKSVCGISYSGEVFPCIGAPIASGNLREKTFAEIWKNSEVLNKIRNLKRDDFKSCQTCEYIEFCSRSSGSIYTNTKEYTGCDSSTLQQAKIRHGFFKNQNKN